MNFVKFVQAQLKTSVKTVHLVITIKVKKLLINVEFALKNAANVLVLQIQNAQHVITLIF